MSNKTAQELLILFKAGKDAARMLAYILHTHLTYLSSDERRKCNKIIRRYYPKYDEDVDPWPSCLTSRNKKYVRR